MSYWNYKSQEDATNFIFGFGSIVNDESRRSIHPESGDPIPVRISPDFGYKRVWNFQSPSAKLTALGLMKVIDPKKRTTINGIIYPVQEENLQYLDEREEGYKRVEVPSHMIQSVNWQKLPDHTYKIWIYIPIIDITTKNNQQGLPADKYYPILQTYIDVVLLGFLKYGEDYALEFLYTTGWWSKYWLNDRQVPRRPWLHQKKYKIIDNILKRYSTEYGLSGVDLFKTRKLPVEFSIYFTTEPCDNNCNQMGTNKSLTEVNFKCNYV